MGNAIAMRDAIKRIVAVAFCLAAGLLMAWSAR